MRNTVIWGIVLWLIGYIAGILLFFVVPKDLIGWVITPLATILTLWVLFKKIKRQSLTDYMILAVIWTLMAVVLDYVFLVKVFKTGMAYYQSDVFIYYLLTLTLPIIVGHWKSAHKPAKAKVF